MALNQADAEFITNPKFLPAFKELTTMVSFECGTALLKGLVLYSEAIRVDPVAGDERSPFDLLPAWLGGPMAVALLHVTMGTPLFLNDRLLALWNQCDGTVAECSRCGYRHPAGVQTCAVCGGRTGGAGCWAKCRARLAVCN